MGKVRWLAAEVFAFLRVRWRRVAPVVLLEAGRGLLQHDFLRRYLSSEFLATLPPDVYAWLEKYAMLPILLVSPFLSELVLAPWDAFLFLLLLPDLTNRRRRWWHGTASGLLGGFTMILGTYLVVGGPLALLFWLSTTHLDWFPFGTPVILYLPLFALPALASFLTALLEPLFILDGYRWGPGAFRMGLRRPWRWVGWMILLYLTGALLSLPFWGLWFLLREHPPARIALLLGGIAGGLWHWPGYVVIYRRLRATPDPGAGTTAEAPEEG